MNSFVTLLTEGAGGASQISQIITSAANEIKSEAFVVIGVAVGIGVVFWGARLLWSRFKGMAK